MRKPPPAWPADPDGAFLRRAEHDIRSSLRALRKLPGWVSEDLADAGIAAPEQALLSLGLLESHARRLENMLDGMLGYLCLESLPGEKAALAPALASALAEEPLPRGARLRMRIAPGLAVPLSAAQAAMLFRIPIANAVAHHPAQPAIRILARRHGGQAEVLVADDGPGIPPELRTAACAPLGKLRPRDEDEGAGLGLAILDRLLQFHGGRLSLETPGSGTGLLVRITLPQAQPERRGAAPGQT